MLQRYHWPGNIRELQNLVERAVILCESETFSVDASWIAPIEDVRASTRTAPFALSLADHERHIIENALAESRGKIAGPAGAAEKLGVPRQTLDSRITSLGIDKRRFKTQRSCLATRFAWSNQ